MSFREFEGKSHASVYKKYREKPPKELIDRITGYLKEKYTGNLAQAVDLGCGSGQCTFLLGDYFEKVLGTDISAAQIREGISEATAKGVKNVTFLESSADKIPLENDSVQLVTACTAAHWFDLPKVFEEGRRVLCENGVMAFFCSMGAGVFIEGKEQELAELQQSLRDFSILHGAPPVKVAFDKYLDIEIPYADFIREDGFGSEHKGSISEVIGNIRSYSPFQAYCKKNGGAAGEEFLKSIQNRLLEISGLSEKDLEAPVLTMKVNYFLIMARLNK